MRIWFFILVIILLLATVSAICDEGQVDINEASAEELDEIIWVGSATAEKIIAARPFDSVDSLIEVSGIGEIKLEDIKEQDLACVNNEKDDETEPEKLQENREQKIEEKTPVEQQKTPEELQVIELNPKVIKSDESRNLNNNLALYGFVAFSVLIVILYLIKGNKDKNEFR